MIRRALAGSLVLFVVAVGAALAEAPISLDEYRGIVRQAHALVDRAASEANSAARAPLLAQAADLLERVTDVETAPGVSFRIANFGLVRDVRTASKARTATGLGDLSDRLAALDAFLVALPTEPSPSERAKLLAIFDRPPFVQEQNLLAQLQRQFLEWLGRLLSNMSHGLFDLRDVIVLIGAGIVLVATSVLLYALGRNLVASAQIRRKGMEQSPLTAAGALAQARRFSNAGNYREAVRELYLATLLMLDERGLLRFDRALTNREYLDAVAGKPAVRAALEPIVNTFDRAWYGFQALGQEEFEGYSRQVEGMRDL